MTDIQTINSALGAYLKDRRSKVDPAGLGFTTTRRRTPGLRREEVAQRASISVTWYTWLEQGRGGAPSVEVLDRIAQALLMTEIEREHLFLLAFGHPPEVQFRPPEGISPRLQRLLDALEFSPAYVMTAAWDLVTWNRAAATIFGYDTLDPKQRNILRRIFCDASVRTKQSDWDSVARFAVAAFRADATRAGATDNINELVGELCRLSPEFDTLWRNYDVLAYSEGTKYLQIPQVGTLSLEYSSFVVDGRPDLKMVVFNPATTTDADLVRLLLGGLV